MPPELGRPLPPLPVLSVSSTASMDGPPSTTIPPHNAGTSSGGAQSDKDMHRQSTSNTTANSSSYSSPDSNPELLPSPYRLYQEYLEQLGHPTAASSLSSSPDTGLMVMVPGHLNAGPGASSSSVGVRGMIPIGSASTLSLIPSSLGSGSKTTSSSVAGPVLMNPPVVGKRRSSLDPTLGLFGKTFTPASSSTARFKEQDPVVSSVSQEVGQGHYRLRRLSVSSSGHGHGPTSTPAVTMGNILGIGGSSLLLSLGQPVDAGSSGSGDPGVGKPHYALRRLSRDQTAAIEAVDGGNNGEARGSSISVETHGDLGLPHASTFNLGPALSLAGPSTSASAFRVGSSGESDSDFRSSGSGVSTPTRLHHLVTNTTPSKTRPLVSPLIIPNQPVFFSYPVVGGKTSALTDDDEDELETPTRLRLMQERLAMATGETSVGGRRRRTSAASGSGSISISDRGHHHHASHGARCPPTAAPATSRYRRRSPSLQLPSGLESNAGNPLAHTWGRSTDTPAEQESPAKRRRRATVGNAEHGRQRSSVGAAYKFGQLPPGAMPAVDPARHAFAELSPVAGTSTQGWAIGDAPSGRIKVPRRTSSLTIKTRKERQGSLDWSAPRSSAHGHAKLPEPFIYHAGSDVNFMLHAVPGGTGLGQGRPLVSPALSGKSRGDHLGTDFFSSKPTAGSSVLGLEQDGHSTFTFRAPTATKDAQALADEVEAGARDLDPRASYDGDHDPTLRLPSLTGTSSGLGTAEVTLSSASTSLSRSGKNAKDGQPAIADSTEPNVSMDDLSKALRDRLAIRIERSDRRKYQLVELVETEVAYTSHLRDLVEIFLPQLAALSCITESDHKIISRNLGDMLYFHEQFSARMVDVLKEEHLGTEADSPTPVDEPARTERMIRKVSAVFIEDASGLEIYNEYCAGSAAAMDIIRAVHQRPDWHAFEKRCRVVAATRAHKDLYSMLRDENPNFVASSVPPATLSSTPSRLWLRDLLILPVQRICRYPLVLHSLNLPGGTPSPALEEKIDFSRSYDVGVDPARALAVAKMAAAKADEANRRSIAISRTNAIAKKLEVHPIITRPMLNGLGPCILAGAVDMLYHHSLLAPLVPPLRVKYYGAFIYNGFILFVKVKKSSYEIRHYLPLEMFELIDVTEGFLPCSIRLSFLEHHFDLAMTCQQEKDVWATALCAARDNAVVLPFDLPCSIFSRGTRSRRDSAVLLSDHTVTPVKRNSLVSFDPVASSPMTPLTRTPAQGVHAELAGDVPVPASPTTPMTPMTPLRRQTALSSGTPQTILLRRASPWHRTVIDEHLVFSEEISLARMSADSRSIVPPSPKPGSGGNMVRNRMSIRDSSVLKRRRSYIELQGFGGHARTDSAASAKDDYRSLRTPTSTKRASFAGSIKRGLSMSLHDDHVESWHTPAMATTSLLSSPEISAAAPIAIPLSPQRLTGGTLHEEPLQDSASVDLPSNRQAQRHARSQSQGFPSMNPPETPQRTATGSLPRKQSLTRLGSFFGRVKTDGSHSLPSSPSVNVIARETTRTGSNTPLDSMDPAASGYFHGSHHAAGSPIYSSGAGFTNIRPEMPTQPSFLTRSMSFAKLKGKTGPTAAGTSESTGGWDSRRSSVDADGILSSSTYSTPSEPPHGLQSVPGSPSEPAGRSLDEAVGITSTPVDPQAGGPTRSRAPSEAGTEGSTRSTSDSGDRRPGSTDDKLPKRRRSVRFLNSIKIKGLTSITGHHTSQA